MVSKSLCKMQMTMQYDEMVTGNVLLKATNYDVQSTL